MKIYIFVMYCSFKTFAVAFIMGHSESDISTIQHRTQQIKRLSFLYTFECEVRVTGNCTVLCC